MANNKTDYTKPHTDLIELLPEPLRSDVNISLFNNVFNRYLTKQEIEKVAGYIGRGNTAAIRPRQIHEQDVHRQAYQLQPIPYNKIGTIEHMTSWKDMQNELERLGVDMDAFSEWGATQKFNWVPPIDINKIINYRDYYWVDPEDANSIPQYITIRSTCATATAKFNFWDGLIAQHGSTFQIGEILPSDATPATYTITEFIDSPNSIKVEGDVTTDILLGDHIDVIGSVNNDETYRITSTPTYSGVTNDTTLKVDKTIVADTPAASAEVSSRRFDKLVLPANATLVGSPPVAVEDLGNYTSLFTEGFVFFIRNSTNTDLNSTFVETISSTYDADKKETTVIINQRVTDDTADGEISLEEQFSIFEADMNCQCDNFGGWDISPWDDNPLEPLWGDSEDADGNPTPDGISDHENLITRISHTTPPVSGGGVEGELWYDTTENILYQNSALPLTTTNVDTFIASGSPVATAFTLSAPISTGTIVTAEEISGSPITNLNVSYTADGTLDPVVTVLDPLSANDIIEITYETPIWTVVWRNFSLILEQTTGIALWDLSLSCDTRPRITATEQWITENKWFHKNDVVNFTSVQRANQPIIEYDWDLELNEWTYVNYNWSYRRIITESFSATAAIPPRIELEPLTWWEQTDDTAVDNTIILDDRYGDLTDYFVEGRTVFLVDDLLKTTYTVVSSSYKTADITPATGEYVFPYRTYITFDNTVIGVGSPILTNNLSEQRPNAISIIPVMTTQGDTWKDYGVHWLFVGVDDAVPAPHQVPNSFMDIDVTSTPVEFPPPIFHAIAVPIDFVSTNTLNVNQDFEVDWGNGTFVQYPAGNISGVASGTVIIRSFNPVTKIFFSTDTFTDVNIDVSSTVTDLSGSFENVGGLTTFAMADASNVTTVFQAWNFCSLTSFPLIDLSSCTNFGGAWAGNSFTSFPPIDTSSGVDFDTAWLDCDGLTSFPALDFSSALTMGGTWDNCGGLTSFPDISMPVCIWMTNLFRSCTSLVSIGTLNTAAGTRMERMFQNCTSLTCITDVNTTNLVLSFAADDMFTNTPLLTAPSLAEQALITTIPGGLNYVNVGDCPPLPAGSPPAGSPPAGSPPAGSPPAGSPPAGSPPAGSPPAPAVSSWDISTASLSGPYALLSEGFWFSGFSFGDSGNKLYTVQTNNDQIYQYVLSTPYNVHTAVYDNKNISLVGEISQDPLSIEFNPSGTRMFITGNNNSVYTFTLNTPWDITSWQTPFTSNTALDGSVPTGGIHFSDDGLKMVTVHASGIVRSYTLGAAFSPTTLVQPAANIIDLAATDAHWTGVHISSDGTKMYLTGRDTDTLYQYALSPAWDVSTASPTTSISLASIAEVEDVYFNSTGTEMYLLGGSDLSVFQQTLDTAWTIQALDALQDVFTPADASPQGLTFSADGTDLFVVGDTTNKITRYALSPAYDITSANPTPTSEYLVTEDATINDVAFNPTGTKMYVLGAVNDTVFQYTLSPAWDVSSAVNDAGSQLITTALETTPEGMYIGDNGTKCYILGSGSNEVYQYTLSTPWDVTTGVSYSTLFKDISPTVTQGSGEVYFKPDGTIMYVVNPGWDARIWQYALGTAWKVDTAVYDNKFYETSLEWDTTGIVMTPDGLELYLVGTDTGDVQKYTIDPLP